MCQYLAVESTHPSSPLFEDSSSSEATTPVTVQHMRPPKQKKHKTSPVPPAPIVLQLMEMGFQRKNIEFALKSLSGTTGGSGVPGSAPIAQVFEMLNCHIFYLVVLQWHYMFGYSKFLALHCSHGTIEMSSPFVHYHVSNTIVFQVFY